YVERALQLVDLAAHDARVVDRGERAVETVLTLDQKNQPAPAKLDVVAGEKIDPRRNGRRSCARVRAGDAVAILDAAPPLPGRDDRLHDALLGRALAHAADRAERAREIALRRVDAAAHVALVREARVARRLRVRRLAPGAQLRGVERPVRARL